MDGGAPQLVSLTWRPSSRSSLFGPLSAALAGALASHRLSTDGGALITLGLLALLADPALGGLWSVVTGGGWRQRWQDSAGAEKSARLLPHTVEGSPAHRAGGWLARVASPGVVDAVVASAVYFAAALALAAALGPAAVAVVAAGMAMTLVATMTGPAGAVGAAIEALYFFGLAWALGFVAAGGLVSGWWPSPMLAIAAMWTVVYWGYRRLCAGGDSGALAAVDGGQGAIAIVLAASGRPWQAGAVAVLLAAEALGQPGMARGGAANYARNSLIFLLPALALSFL